MTQTKQQKRGRARTLVGTIISAKANRTVSVSVVRRSSIRAMVNIYDALPDFRCMIRKVSRGWVTGCRLASVAR